LTKPVRAAALRTALASALGKPADSRPEPPAASAAVAGLRVLVAEDNVVNQQVVSLMLDRLGHRVQVVSNGEEVLAALHESPDSAPYDVVLMDLQMPVMDGLEATRRIRSTMPTDRQPWIVALTASAALEDAQESTAAGMDDFLSKPIRADDLVATLERVPRSAAFAE
jgi:CheY-like chemotaxis protein